MDEIQVITLVAEVLGTRPLSATHQAFGHCSVTYELTLPARSVIVRMNEDAQVFATTERNIAALASLGLPVPKVLASDLSKTRHPFAYVLLDTIPGRDLRYELAHMAPAQMTRLAQQIVDFQRRVMALPQGTGYGYVGIGEAGPHASWWEVIHAGHGQSSDQSSDEALREYGARILRQAARFQPYFRQVPPICFLDDITVKNVIVQNGELQGLVDFDCVCYGDPLYWLALTATGVVSDVGTAELFYVEQLKRLWGLTPEQEQVLAFYSAWVSLGFVQQFAAQETSEWKARMLDAISQWVMIADRSC